MTTFAANDPRRFWPDTNSDSSGGSDAGQVRLEELVAAAPDVSREHEETIGVVHREHTDAHKEHERGENTRHIPIRRIPVADTAEHSPEQFGAEDADQNPFLPRLQALHIPDEPVEPVEIVEKVSPIEHLADEMDVYFKHEMQEDEARVRIAEEQKSWEDDELDAYGFVRRGARGPRQMSARTTILITFGVLFVVSMTFFLVTFIMSVQHKKTFFRSVSHAMPVFRDILK